MKLLYLVLFIFILLFSCNKKKQPQEINLDPLIVQKAKEIEKLHLVNPSKNPAVLKDVQIINEIIIELKKEIGTNSLKEENFNNNLNSLSKLLNYKVNFLDMLSFSEYSKSENCILTSLSFMEYIALTEIEKQFTAYNYGFDSLELSAIPYNDRIFIFAQGINNFNPRIILEYGDLTNDSTVFKDTIFGGDHLPYSFPLSKELSKYKKKIRYQLMLPNGHIEEAIKILE